MNWVMDTAKTMESWFNKKFAWYFTNGMKVIETRKRKDRF